MPDSSNQLKTSSTANDKDEDALTIPANRPLLPPLRSDSPVQPHSLEEFREAEGRDNRKQKLTELWQSLPELLHPSKKFSKDGKPGGLTQEQALSLKAMYDSELLLRCATPTSSSRPPHIGWREFKEYSLAKEAGMTLFTCSRRSYTDYFQTRTMAYLP